MKAEAVVRSSGQAARLVMTEHRKAVGARTIIARLGGHGLRRLLVNRQRTVDARESNRVTDGIVPFH